MPNLIEQELKALVDHHGLTHVVHTLAAVCTERAEHLRTNCPDMPATANVWDANGKTLTETARLLWL
jgi:hypothetical protein